MLDFTMLIIILVVTIIIFLLFREIICWYWKINEGVKTLIEIRDLLKTITLANNTSQTKIVKQSKNNNAESQKNIDVSKNNIVKSQKNIYVSKDDKINNIKLDVASKLFNELESDEEYTILTSLLNLEYFEIVEMGKNPVELTQVGKKIVKILLERIDKEISLKMI